MSSLEEEDLLLVAAVCRGIWLRRNKFIFEGIFTQPSKVVSKAKEAVEDFYQASLECRDPTNSNLDNSIIRWESPPMGVGVVVLDHKGAIMACKSVSKPYICDPTVAKAMVAWVAVSLCGFNN